MTRRLTWTLGNFGLEAFESVQQVAQLERTRFHKSSGKTQHETRYFISNARPGELKVEQVMQFIRQHWQIENGLHRTRDVHFKEDASSVRTGNLPRVMAALSNLLIGFLTRRGWTSITQAAEHFVAQPRDALELLLVPL